MVSRIDRPTEYWGASPRGGLMSKKVGGGEKSSRGGVRGRGSYEYEERPERQDDLGEGVGVREEVREEESREGGEREKGEGVDAKVEIVVGVGGEGGGGGGGGGVAAAVAAAASTVAVRTAAAEKLARWALDCRRRAEAVGGINVGRGS